MVSGKMKVLFLYRGKNDEGDNRVVVTQGKTLESAGVDIDYFPLTGRGPGAYLRAVSAIRKRLRTGGAWLIHAHYGISGLAGLFAAGSKPLIVSFMGTDLLGSHRPGGRKGAASRLMAFINRWLARRYYSLSIVKSSEMQGKLFRNTRHALIPNGVDLGAFAPVDRVIARRQMNLDPEGYIVLFPAGRNNPEKNFLLASDTADLLRERGFRLMDVNNASREEMNLLINAADLLLVTSFHEGSPNIVKEAMACCCPVVSTSVGDIPWLFGDTPGHYLTGFDAREIAARMEEAVRFRREYRFTDGRSRIEQLGLDSESIARIIMDHYSRLSAKA
jgi:glycosyltransferase involved in cell wall biosynthesis